MSRNLALFDLDHTLLPLDSDQAWAHFIAGLGVEGAVRHAQEIDDYYRQYVAGTLDMAAYLNYTLAPLARHSREQLNAWHAQFMQQVIAPAILPAARELVQRHLDAGDLCCIVTATNVFITEPIGKALGFEHLLGIELGTEGGDPSARFTGTAVGTPTFREGKITRTESWLASLGHRLQDFHESWFYSDSINDVPLLERVTHPVATNPDPRLRAVASERGWPVIELFA
ncbi:HAD phosphoserine phosphatase-like hydrolase, IB family protein [Paraburkholderia xenovorans LB400]|jgi:HAD superfamily hydrolase (TIGR01490 family)|uniref:HAD-superfamily hydrolase, subfamily IB(PSPase-like) n=1 Tax=Paraburkholderia xenovorans (strain LB400) TaxID=266265 RepID=Q146E5_PARXL|nr:HAD family hydrolase [Paraburkholderia xenovorans]ABE28794.1 HAD-superfamily hydrolase, subfamily IB(PSPase- like) [Paraburkholderia xenovorans LB400]AIP33487.1 HAD phosphoserine phosphatase-like hydrolase, IB family protein [Paraburkholderia xenovorans LB400]